MPRRDAKGPRLYFRERKGKAGRPGVFVIRDGTAEISTGCVRDDRAGAERALSRYLAQKHVATAAQRSRHPADIPIVDVLALYLRDVAPEHAKPRETLARVQRLRKFFGKRMLDEVSGKLCRAYVTTRGGKVAARNELADLRAAINYHRREGLCDAVIEVAVPKAPQPRETWLTRPEAAQLLRHCWRYQDAGGRHVRRHLARFILVALYTGTRSGALLGAAFNRVEGFGFVDLDRGMLYRRPHGRRETSKRQPPAPLPNRLLAHLRRWHAHGARYVVEYDGRPVTKISKAFRNAVRDAGLPKSVTPHTLRHTCATWLMHDGVDPWEAAGYLGMTLETLTRTYAHHHAGAMAAARRAFDQRGKR